MSAVNCASVSGLRLYLSFLTSCWIARMPDAPLAIDASTTTATRVKMTKPSNDGKFIVATSVLLRHSRRPSPPDLLDMSCVCGPDERRASAGGLAR
jgi:hypothetical protein